MIDLSDGGCGSLVEVRNLKLNDDENIIIALTAQMDRPDSAIDQNNQDVMQAEIRTLTITEESANRFLRLVHGNTIDSSLEAAAEQLTITSFSKANAIKDTAQLLTGTTLELNIIVPDDFNYCSLANLA